MNRRDTEPYVRWCERWWERSHRLLDRPKALIGRLLWMHGQLIILSYYHPPMSRPFTMLRWKLRAAKLMIQLLKAIRSNNPQSFGDSELWKLKRKGQRKSDAPDRRAMQPENGKLCLLIERDQPCIGSSHITITSTPSEV